MIKSMAIKRVVKLVVLACIVPIVISATASLINNARPSFADRLHVSHAQDSVDHGWLADLTGLPDKAQTAQLTQQAIDVIGDERDNRCIAIDPNLRLMFFQHFLIYQQMMNGQHIYLNKNIAYQWAHVLAMILKESSGDSANISDMLGHSITTYRPATNLQQWERILTLTKKTRVALNFQTNFGLTQISSDRLFNAFRIAKDQSFDTTFLEGQEGAATPRKIVLNTAIAIRRLIWFYQDFAQGRFVEAERRIHHRDIDKPEYIGRYNEGLNRTLLYCGTQFMFQEGYPNSQEIKKLRQAVSSIAYCKLGNAQNGYGKNDIDAICFAQWVTICPALNIDIATLTPLQYFATRNERPVCKGAFEKLLKKNPNSIQEQLKNIHHSVDKKLNAWMGWLFK